jgi:Flp pilus assembly protein TadG
MSAPRDRRRGQSLVEFAIVVPLFMAVVIGIAEGGYYVIASTIVNHATHEGARMGVLASTSDEDAVRNRVRSEAAAVIALTSGAISVCVEGKGCGDSQYQSRGTGDRLKVTTSYAHSPLVSYVFPGLAFPANAEAELLVEGAPS